MRRFLHIRFAQLILAAALLLAQGLVVSHQHDLANDALGADCEVCLQLTHTDSLAPATAAPVPDGVGCHLSIDADVNPEVARVDLPQARGPPALA